MTAEEKTNSIFDLFIKQKASEYHGEPVSQLEHMYQSASLAAALGYDEEVILAAFFHDIGYFLKDNHSLQMDDFGNAEHEKLEATYLREMGFSEKICRLTEEHVNAKRYLCYAFPSYSEALSDASKKSLIFQGGAMQKEEAEKYEQDPLFETIIQMRKWDEAAKEEGVTIFNEKIAQYKNMALAQLM